MQASEGRLVNAGARELLREYGNGVDDDGKIAVGGDAKSSAKGLAAAG